MTIGVDRLSVVRLIRRKARHRSRRFTSVPLKGILKSATEFSSVDRTMSMQRSALYFPYIHVRDDNWLKAAALYWPSIGRIVPSGYPKHDSVTAAVFADERILEDVSPGGLVDESAWDFVATIKDNIDEVVSRYRLPGADPNSVGELGWVHVQKVPSDLCDLLVGRNVAVRGREAIWAQDRSNPELTGAVGRAWASHQTNPWDWIGLRPALAGAYMTALACQISERAFFEPLTDQTDLRVATPNADVRAALKLLLGRPVDPDRAVTAAATEAYVMLALQQVLPANLDQLGPEKIVQCRGDLQEELTAFRACVKDRQAELVEIAQIPEETYRLEAFARYVESTVEQPLARLERGLKLLKIPSTRSVLTTTALTPPVIVGGDHLASASPMAASAAAAAVLVGSAWWAVSDARAAARAASPIGYLLDVRDQLTPKTVLSRAKRIVRGTYK